MFLQPEHLVSSLLLLRVLLPQHPRPVVLAPRSGTFAALLVSLDVARRRNLLANRGQNCLIFNQRLFNRSPAFEVQFFELEEGGREFNQEIRRLHFRW